MMDAVNVTHAEHFLLYGTLTERRCLELIALSEHVCDLSDAVIKVREGMGQFPAEDFLSDVQEKLNKLRDKLRGDNKDTLSGILESLEDIAQCTFNASDYGRSELKDAIKIMDEKA